MKNSGVAKNEFMREALIQAKLALKNDEVPVGCVVVEDNKIIAFSYNQNRFYQDPTAHAEIMAIKKACQMKNNSQLNNCDLYVTLEPCPMCLMAISYARIRRVYYGANDEKFGAVESNPIFTNNNLAVFKSEIYSGINAEESKLLLKNFFQNKRQK